MTLVPLAPHDPAMVRDALVRRGMEPGRAEAAARGLAPQRLLFDRLEPAARDALVDAARRHGVEWLSGDDWVLVAGGVARLAGLARPGASTLPAALAAELGRHLQGATQAPPCWQVVGRSLSLARPLVAGVLNVTPDSFSDGGRYTEPTAALRHADALVAAGADLIDIGAEATRPGRPEPVTAEEEWRRLAPVLPALVRHHPTVPISVDTVKAEIARRALDAGAAIINDVSGLRLDPAVADPCAAHGAGLILMHSRGSVTDMATYDHAQYDDVTAEVVDELARAVAVAEARGVSRAQLVVDPGFGFSKTPEHTWRVFVELGAVLALGLPVMVGPSRKRFLGAVTGKDAATRDHATAVACALAYRFGARLFRVHAVAPTREALALATAVGAR